MGKRNDRHRRDRGEDDGASGDHRGAVDPAQFFSPIGNGRSDRKVQQICKEVERTVACTVAACEDPLIGELMVVAVEPAPDASRLMVSLCAPRAGLSAADLLERLDRIKGLLRQEVAAALQRKRTPELCFRLAAPLGPDDEGEGGQDGAGGHDGDDGEGWP